MKPTLSCLPSNSAIGDRGRHANIGRLSSKSFAALAELITITGLPRRGAGIVIKGPEKNKLAWFGYHNAGGRYLKL